eukprot:464446-Prymnesium_polylepis.1
MLPAPTRFSRGCEPQSRPSASSLSATTAGHVHLTAPERHGTGSSSSSSGISSSATAHST